MSYGNGIGVSIMAVSTAPRPLSRATPSPAMPSTPSASIQTPTRRSAGTSSAT